MKVRAVAAPSPDSTAIGSVELECAPHGLLMLYLSVGAYSEGYAPGAVTSGTRSVAAWPDVLDVRTSGDAILLSVNPRLTPHHRLCLTNFSAGDVDPAALGQRRRLLRAAVVAMMLAVGVSIAASIPVWTPGAGQLTALGLGLTAACGVLFVGLVAERLWLPLPPDSDALRRGLLAEIQHYRPAPVLPATHAEERPLRLADLLEALPRSTTAIVIVLSAGSLAAVLTSSWILGEPESRPRYAERSRADDARGDEAPLAAALPQPEPKPIEAAAPPPATSSAVPAAAPSTSAPAATAALDSAPAGDVCSCTRADSVLWRLPFPRLSTLMIAQSLRAHEDHHHVDLELAVVNNGKTPLQEISLLVRFFEDSGKKPTKDRPLYYESWLNPGAAIKWHVDARGSSFVVQNPVDQLLGPGELATADAFAELLSANHRPVRLHAAMMLAYLDDPRAKDGAAKLREALREEEAPYLDRVLASQSSTIACDLRSNRVGTALAVEACVFNRGAEPRDDLELEVRGLDRDFDFRHPLAEPPVVVAEKSFRLPGQWAPNAGRWVRVAVDPDAAAPKVASVEAFVHARGQ